eukprot:TRINITY_DN781892_c0_g1_i1.p1 TRINITY_DN781892_c0_g1~~TRINITY_DN781892_c0_g1_i1.p1  ORF type:complete len:371 (+),score=81.65 TRINITY_DN781892_c0_g1_i1:104-1216(+)
MDVRIKRKYQPKTVFIPKRLRKRYIDDPWAYPIKSMKIAAIEIQRVFRGHLVRSGIDIRPPTDSRYFASRIDYNTTICQLAALSIQNTWRTHSRNRYMALGSNEEAEFVLRQSIFEAVRTIERWWAFVQNRKIFRFYKELLVFKTDTTPHLLLRCINPVEAQLLESSSGTHVRFRLGGVSFPPNIYYKIFIHQNVCDINAFAPRDYTRLNEVPDNGSQKHAITNKECSSSAADQYMNGEEVEGWYRREDNNGWRVIHADILERTEVDPITKETSSKRRYYHFDKQIRQEQKKQHRRKRKKEWMQKMYREGFSKEQEEMNNNNNMTEEDRETKIPDEEAEQLLEWTDSLSFDTYMDDWSALSTAVAEVNIQ